MVLLGAINQDLTKIWNDRKGSAKRIPMKIPSTAGWSATASPTAQQSGNSKLFVLEDGCSTGSEVHSSLHTHEQLTHEQFSCCPLNTATSCNRSQHEQQPNSYCTAYSALHSILTAYCSCIAQNKRTDGYYQVYAPPHYTL